MALAALLGLGLAVLFATLEKARPGTVSMMPVSNDAFGGPLTNLTKHTGVKVSAEDFKGQYKLIYFGFTYCPAICPTELGKITSVMNIIGEDKATKIDPIFITVDPERDTADALAKYVSMFHPRLTGLTGDTVEITQTLKEYKIYAAKAQDPAMTEYTMDHSSFIYFMAPDNRLLHIFKIDDQVDDMAERITSWIEYEFYESMDE